MKRGITGGTFPAASLLVGSPTEIIFAMDAGQARPSTCYDIASLTKPIATATLAMQFVAEELLDLKDPLSKWFENATQDYHQRITVEHLLCHRAGFPPWQPYYRELPLDLAGSTQAKHHIIEAALREPLINPTGEKSVYSDIDYILLGEILEKVGLASLDVLFQQRVAKPLNLQDTFFVKIVGNALTAKQRHYTTATQHIGDGESIQKDPYAGKTRRFAPTEDCPWRERVVHGEVHDWNAYAMGGAAGHAGLFSTTHNLHCFLQEFHRTYLGLSDFIPQTTIQQFIDYPHQQGEYVLGWDTPAKTHSSAGRFFSPHSIGHLGFTGTSIWIDLEKEYWVILLSNRIHPTTTNNQIKAFRPLLHELVFHELIKKRT